MTISELVFFFFQKPDEFKLRGVCLSCVKTLCVCHGTRCTERQLAPAWYVAVSYVCCEVGPRTSSGLNLNNETSNNVTRLCRCLVQRHLPDDGYDDLDTNYICLMG